MAFIKFLKNKHQILTKIDLAQVTQQEAPEFINKLFTQLQLLASEYTIYKIPSNYQIIEETTRIISLLEQTKKQYTIIIDAFDLSWFKGEGFFQYMRMIEFNQKSLFLNFLWIADRNLPWKNI